MVSEGTRGEPSSNSGGTNKVRELEDSPLTLNPGADDADIGRLLNGGNDPGCDVDLLPHLPEMQDVDSYARMKLNSKS